MTQNISDIDRIKRYSTSRELFKKEIRVQLRDVAKMGYGINIKDLSKEQLKVGLDSILKQNYSYWKNAKYGTLEEYKQAFREAFRKELKIIKEKEESSVPKFMKL